jgi:PAS domain S-box-containing protein
MRINFSELVNIDTLKRMADNLFVSAAIPVGILDTDGTIYVKTGWQDICTKFHRVNKETCSRCMISDKYLNDHLMEDRYIEYKCLNNMWDIAVPIIIAGRHLATIFIGQFFYDDEIIDIEFFRKQAIEFGFDEKEYLNALSKVPKFPKEKIQSMIEYYLALVMTLAESGLRQLEYENSQKKLANNQKYLNSILNSVNESIFIHDFYGNIIDTNKTVIYMFGFSMEELKNMNINDLIAEKSIITKNEVFEIYNKARDNNPIIFECLCKNKNNNEFWTEVNISALKIEEEEQIISTVRDITDRKISELAREKEAHELEVLRTEFFANISHELKTPLNIIFGVIQLIKLEIEDIEKPINREKVLNNLNIQKQNCFRLLRLMNNLIDSTKLDSGDIELNMTNCNIIYLVEEITLSVAEYINNNNIKLTFDTDVEEKMLACDLDRIERIMLNLLSNAVKFTEAGGEIFVNIYDGKDYITIVVEDTGIGIPSQKLNVIFDRFRQVDKSFARNHEGSGIGLSIVKSLVEMHGGSISVESEYGLSTKFILRIPIKILDSDYCQESINKNDSTADKYVERIKIEFSDIYK